MTGVFRFPLECSLFRSKGTDAELEKWRIQLFSWTLDQIPLCPVFYMFLCPLTDFQGFVYLPVGLIEQQFLRLVSRLLFGKEGLAPFWFSLPAGHLSCYSYFFPREGGSGSRLSFQSTSILPFFGVLQNTFRRNVRLDNSDGREMGE